MSANNFIKISKTKKGFLIQNLDIESKTGFEIGKADTFKKARKIADEYMMNGNIVEYGIRIDEKCFND